MLDRHIAILKDSVESESKSLKNPEDLNAKETDGAGVVESVGCIKRFHCGPTSKISSNRFSYLKEGSTFPRLRVLIEESLTDFKSVRLFLFQSLQYEIETKSLPFKHRLLKSVEPQLDCHHLSFCT